MNEHDEMIQAFISEHADLFRAIWERLDDLSGADWDEVSSAWDEECDVEWSEVEERMDELLDDFDWSLQDRKPISKEEARYEESDILFDAQREQRHFGPGKSRD